MDRRLVGLPSGPEREVRRRGQEAEAAQVGGRRAQGRDERAMSVGVPLEQAVVLWLRADCVVGDSIRACEAA